MKKFIAKFLFVVLPFLGFGQTVEEQFSGFGNIENVTSLGSSNYAVELTGFTGSPRFEVNGTWSGEDVAENDVIFKDGARYVITSVDDSNLGGFDVIVNSPDEGLGVSPLNDGDIVAVGREFSNGIFPMPRQGDNAGTGIPPSLASSIAIHNSAIISAVSGGSGVDYVTQSSPPTDTLKFWMDNGTYPLTKYNVLKQYVNSAWHIKGYYNTVSEEFSVDKPKIGGASGQSQIFGQQNSGTKAQNSHIVQFNNANNTYQLSASIGPLGTARNTPQFQVARQFAEQENRLVTIQTTSLGGQDIDYFLPGGAGWDSLVLNQTIAGFSEWGGADYWVFGQGESDAATEDSTYIRKVYQYFGALRDSGYLKPDAPIVAMGMVNPGNYTAKDSILSTLNYDDDIRTGYISGKGLYSFDGGTHFAGTAVDTIGSRMYWRLKAMMDKYDYEPTFKKVGDNLIFQFGATADTASLAGSIPGIETYSADSTVTVDLTNYTKKVINLDGEVNIEVDFTNLQWGEDFIFHFKNNNDTIAFGDNILLVDSSGSVCLVDSTTTSDFIVSAYSDSTYLYITNSTNTLACREFDPDYADILFVADSLGYTLPSINQQHAQNRLMLGMKLSGMFAREDYVLILATDGDADYALLNWKNPRVNKATNVNSCTFTPNEGFKGNGTNSYINTNYNPSTEGVNFTLNDASMLVYVNEAVTGNFALGTTSGAVTWIQTANASNNNMRINSNGNISGGNVATTGAGLKALHRTSNTAITIALNATTYNRTQTSSSIFNSDMFGLRVSSNYSTQEISMIGFGASLVNEYSAFRTAWLTYLNNL